MATVLVSLVADRMGRRSFLLILSLLSGAAGIALAVSLSLPVLATLAFVGDAERHCTDRSAASALDQAVIPGLVSDCKRTWSMAWYNVLLDGGGALGAIAAALPISSSAQTICFGATFLPPGAPWLFRAVLGGVGSLLSALQPSKLLTRPGSPRPEPRSRQRVIIFQQLSSSVAECES